MFGGHPFYVPDRQWPYGYDDTVDANYPYSMVHPESRRNSNTVYRQRQRAAAEAARRRAAAERYYRMKELEEQEELKRRRDQARLMELHRQKQMESEAYRRQLYQERLRRQQQQQRDAKESDWARRNGWYGDEDDDDDDGDEYSDSDEFSDSDNKQYRYFQDLQQPKYQLVRGQDGYLYRMPVQPHRAMHNRSKPSRSKSPVRSQRASTMTHGGLDPAVSEIFEETRKRNDSVGRERQSGTEASEATFKIRNKSAKDRKAVCVSSGAKNNVVTDRKTAKHRTPLVEDASDSEMEDGITRSVWRKRLPSPGQWMEPVEAL